MPQNGGGKTIYGVGFVIITMENLKITSYICVGLCGQRTLLTV